MWRPKIINNSKRATRNKQSHELEERGRGGVWGAGVTRCEGSVLRSGPGARGCGGKMSSRGRTCELESSSMG